MSCTVEQRERLERVADELPAADTRVVGVDTFPPQNGPRHYWTLHATIEGQRVPASVLRELAIESCALLDVTPQGPDHVTLLARP